MPCAFAKILSFSPRKRSTSSYNWAYLVAGGGLHDPMIFVLVFFEHIFLTSYLHTGDAWPGWNAWIASTNCTDFDERNIRTLMELSQVGWVVSTFHQKDSKCNDIFPAHIIKRPLNRKFKLQKQQKKNLVMFKQFLLSFYECKKICIFRSYIT